MPPRPRARSWAVLLWSAAGVYAGVIFYLSSLPNPFPALLVRFGDKLPHGVEYGGLATVLSLGMRASGVRPGRALALAVLAASLYGASDELHQSFVPGRDADVLDWVVDTVGAALAAGAVFWLGRRWKAGARAP
jgi:VanZ family protein